MSRARCETPAAISPSPRSSGSCQIQPAPGMYLALIEPGSYLDFATPVPFADADGQIIERGVLNDAGGSPAVLRLPYGRCHRRTSTASSRPARRHQPAATAHRRRRSASRRPEDRTPVVFDEARERVATLVSRVVRDRVFRRIVLRAYDERCAVTGLKLINGGGRAEVEAAHIRPVEANGPDIISNGMALSGTAHWMFDRGLIGFDNDMRILVSRQVNDPDSVRSIVNPSGCAILPAHLASRPHPDFVRWHRDHRFKQ